MVDHAAKPPEVHAAQVHLAAGSAPLFSLVEALGGATTELLGILGGHQANAGALAAAWISPASALETAADLPHQAWVGDVAAQIGTAGAQFGVLGVAFEAAKALIPTPAEVAENQLEHLVLLATNILGINTVAIILNRLRYAEMWIRAATAMYLYDATSAATVGSLAALPPPPPAVAAGVDNPLAAVEQALQQPMQQVVQGAEAALGAIAPFAMQTAPVLLSSLPAMAMGLPMMGMSAGMVGISSAMGMVGSAGQAGAHAGEFASTGGWMGPRVPESGGPVAATLSSDGGGGGVGSTGKATAALRSPGPWASSITAAAPAAEPDTSQVPSRIAEAREASTRPATGAGMGMPGVMTASPAPRGSGSEQLQQRKSPLAAAAAMYGGPTQIPVVTGADGAQFVAGRADR